MERVMKGRETWEERLFFPVGTDRPHCCGLLPTLGPPGAEPPQAEAARRGCGGRVARAARGYARLAAVATRQVLPTLGP
jgi:hypothetical protein